MSVLCKQYTDILIFPQNSFSVLLPLHNPESLKFHFSKGPDSKYFSLCAPCGLCRNYSALPLWQRKQPKMIYKQIGVAMSQ